MTLFDFITQYGGVVGLIVYILLHDGIPFLRDKFWPALREDKKHQQFMRRESDARLLDLEERKVVAEEQTAKMLILLSERLSKSEQERHDHDQRMAQAFAQITATQTGMQSVLNVLLDRVTRPPKTGPFEKQGQNT
jgi:hypothetical protein